MLKKIPLNYWGFFVVGFFFFFPHSIQSFKLEISVLLLPPPVRYWESRVCPGELAVQQDTVQTLKSCSSSSPPRPPPRAVRTQGDEMAGSTRGFSSPGPQVCQAVAVTLTNP